MYRIGDLRCLNGSMMAIKQWVMYYSLYLSKQGPLYLLTAVNFAIHINCIYCCLTIWVEMSCKQKLSTNSANTCVALFQGKQIRNCAVQKRKYKLSECCECVTMILLVIRGLFFFLLSFNNNFPIEIQANAQPSCCNNWNQVGRKPMHLKCLVINANSWLQSVDPPVQARQ